MSNTTTRFLKAVAGLVVVLVIFVTVLNWWGDYKSAAQRPASGTTTSTADGAAADATATTGDLGTAVVLIEGLNFRKQPTTDSDTIRGLKKGEKLAIVVAKPDWYQVKDAKNVVGWIAAKSQYVRIDK